MRVLGSREDVGGGGAWAGSDRAAILPSISSLSTREWEYGEGGLVGVASGLGGGDRVPPCASCHNAMRGLPGNAGSDVSVH